MSDRTFVLFSFGLAFTIFFYFVGVGLVRRVSSDFRRDGAGGVLLMESEAFSGGSRRGG